ncbi:hypothetical protein IWW48_002063 [Coemansia sp. RSA 1200]|nr:hypothetical protein IWW48_002063 [Coemansia sp. RSA 1200]
MDKALPFDILCRIFVEAQWPTLAYVSRTLYEVSRSRAVRARYCVAEFGRHRVLDGRVGLAGRRPRMFQQDLVLLLLNMGADPRVDDQWILRHACAQAWEPIVRKLLQMRAGCSGTGAGVGASAGDARAEDSWRGGAAGESQIQNHGGSDARMVDIHDDDDAALRIAAGRGQIGVVRMLVRAGANVHVLGDEPLALAAGNGHTPAVRELLRCGAHAHADNSRALRTAVMGGDANADAIRLLLDAGARVAALDDSCVLAACYKGDGDFPPPPLLLPQQNLDRQLRSLTQAELLKYSYAGTADAALRNTPAAAAPLLAALVHPPRAGRMPRRYQNIASSQSVFSPSQSLCSPATPPPSASIAAIADAAPCAGSSRPAVTHVGVVRLLLAHGADPNARGGRPLAYASARGSVRTAAVLLAYGADVRALDGEPLRAACELGHVGAVRLLLRAGADVHAANEAPLRCAARGGHSAVVDELLAHGAAAAGKGGVAALRAAARSGWAAVVERLVAAGADADDAEFRAIALRSPGLRAVLGMSEPSTHQSPFY